MFLVRIGPSEGRTEPGRGPDEPSLQRETPTGSGDETGRVADRIETLTGDHFQDGYADAFARHAIGLRKARIVERMPSRWTRPDPNRKDKKVQVVDENGKPWDHLRGPGSLVGDLHDFIRSVGGEPGAIRHWMSQQARDSWNDNPQALKVFLARNRDKPADAYWWKHGLQTAESRYRTAVRLAGGERAYSEAMIAQHAFTHELLSRMEFDHKDAARGTVRLMRTENIDVMNLNKLSIGAKQAIIQRGAAESTSIYQEVKVFGTEMTIQDVPLHRVIGTYWQEKTPGRSDDAFLGDRENEFVALLDGVPFDYTGRVR